MASTSTPPIELDPVTQLKIDTAKQKKDTGDQAFKAGEVKDGPSRSLSRTINVYLRVE